MILIGYTNYETVSKTDGRAYKHVRCYFGEQVKDGFGAGLKHALTAELDLSRLDPYDLEIGHNYCVQTRSYQRGGYTFTMITDMR